MIFDPDATLQSQKRFPCACDGRSQTFPKNETSGLLQDEANAHDNAVGTNADKEIDKQVAALINHIIPSVNRARRL